MPITLVLLSMLSGLFALVDSLLSNRPQAGMLPFMAACWLGILARIAQARQPRQPSASFVPEPGMNYRTGEKRARELRQQAEAEETAEAILDQGDN